MEHHRDGDSVVVAVRNSPDYLRRCCINNRLLYDADRFRDFMETDMSSVLACARLPATMEFDLAGTRCVNEYEYCLRLAGRGKLSAEEGPQDVSLVLMFLTKPVHRVGASELAGEGARTSDEDFEVPLEWYATTRKTIHLAEVMVGWNYEEAQVNVICRDQLRRVYVGLPLFWEDWEVPFALRPETPPVCSYLGFRMMFEGPDDPQWWIALSEHAVLCLKGVYFAVLDRQRL